MWSWIVVLFKSEDWWAHLNWVLGLLIWHSSLYVVGLCGIDGQRRTTGSNRWRRKERCWNNCLFIYIPIIWSPNYSSPDDGWRSRYIIFTIFFNYNIQYVWMFSKFFYYMSMSTHLEITGFSCLELCFQVITYSDFIIY